MSLNMIIHFIFCCYIVFSLVLFKQYERMNDKLMRRIDTLMSVCIDDGKSIDEL